MTECETGEEHNSLFESESSGNFSTFAMFTT